MYQRRVKVRFTIIPKVLYALYCFLSQIHWASLTYTFDFPSVTYQSNYHQSLYCMTKPNWSDKAYCNLALLLCSLRGNEIVYWILITIASLVTINSKYAERLIKLNPSWFLRKRNLLFNRKKTSNKCSMKPFSSIKVEICLIS